MKITLDTTICALLVTAIGFFVMSLWFKSALNVAVIAALLAIGFTSVQIRQTNSRRNSSVVSTI